jgi:hypothetical protein
MIAGFVEFIHVCYSDPFLRMALLGVMAMLALGVITSISGGRKP